MPNGGPVFIFIRVKHKQPGLYARFWPICNYKLASGICGHTFNVDSQRLNEKIYCRFKTLIDAS